MNDSDLLAVNETISSFAGIEHHACRFRTALCPDRCGHARDVAVLKIEKYEKYSKIGKYGDDKANTFFWDLNPESEINRANPTYLEIIKSLKIGEKVRLNWDHIYVKDDHGAHPERPVRLLEKLE